MKKGFLCLLLILCISTISFSEIQKDYTIRYSELRSDVQVLDFAASTYEITETVIDGTTYSVIDFASASVLDKKGYAELPFANQALQVHAAKNPVVTVVDAEYEDIQLANHLLPSRGAIYRDQNPADIPYVLDEGSIVDQWYPANLIKKTRPFILRDIRGIIVTFHPFQYNAAKKTLRVYKKIQVKVVSKDEPSDNVLTKDAGKILPVMDDVYRSCFINYDQGSFETRGQLLGEMGDIMVFYTDAFTNAAQKYIKWKREKGFTVIDKYVPIGTNPKSHIADEYSKNSKLLYAQLFGDWLYMQCELGGGENAPMDPMLGCVAGNDNFPDVCIGRFSANDNNEALIQVDKTITYEKNPEAGAAWYSTAINIGSPDDAAKGDDGEADWQHIDNIKQYRLAKFTYNNFHDMYIDSDAALLSDWINEGASLINYAGHGDYFSWGMPYMFYQSSDVDLLTNGSKLPIILALACKNGLFHLYDCFAERWLKNPNGGAIMTLMCSVIQPWAEPMIAQDYMNDIIVGGYDYDTNPGTGTNNSEQRNILGSITYNGIIMMYMENNGEKSLKTLQTWNYFGDVALQIRTDQPEAITVSNKVPAATTYTTTVSIASGPVKDALVSICDGGDRSYSGMTDANGVVSISHPYPKGTSVRVVVSGFNLDTEYMEAIVGEGSQTTPTPTPTATPPQYVNIAIGKKAAVSSTFAAAFPASAAVDGKPGSAWGSSTNGESQWIYVDLGNVTAIEGVGAKWFDKYYASRYEVFYSNDLKNWTSYHAFDNGAGGHDTAYKSVSCRYIGLLLKKRNSIAYGLAELEIYQQK